MPRSAVRDIAGMDTLDVLAHDFERSLTSRNRSPRTIEAYLEAVRLFDTFLTEHEMPRQLRAVTREHVEAWISDQLARWKPATAAVRYRSLQAFFKWAESDGELTVNPMAKMSPPTVVAPPVPVIDEDTMRALLSSTGGKARTFDDFRDAAALRLFYDTGCRLSEVVNLAMSDVDLEACEITVTGKGSRVRRVPFGDATRKALRQYLTARQTHSLAASPWMWLGARGQQLTQSGIAQMLRRRCRLAGLPDMHVHQFRHTAAHNFLGHGGEESDAMRLFGWRSRDMLSRYAASTGEDRARDAYRRVGSPGDRL